MRLPRVQGRRGSIRLGTGLVSQGLSSASNFALVVVMARTTTPSEFGAFAIAYSVTWLLHGVVRGMVGETLSVTLGSRAVSRDVTAPPMGASLLLGAGFGLLLAVIGIFWPGPELGSWFLLLACGLPLLTLQDSVRFVGFASRQPVLAVVSDAVWVAIQVLAWAALWFLGVASAPVLLVAWWLASGVAALAVLGRLGIPRVSSGARWLRLNGRLGSSFAAEMLLSMGAGQGTVYAVGYIVGLPAAGALRGAESLYGPARSLALGLRSVALPESVYRYTSDGRATMLFYSFRVTMLMAGPAVAATLILSLLPAQLGEFLLGDVWRLAEPLMSAVGLSLVGVVLAMGSRLGLRAMQETGLALLLRAATTFLALILGIGGAARFGVLGAAYGLVIANTLGATLGWVLLLTRARKGSG